MKQKRTPMIFARKRMHARSEFVVLHSRSHIFDEFFGVFSHPYASRYLLCC